MECGTKQHCAQAYVGWFAWASLYNYSLVPRTMNAPDGDAQIVCLLINDVMQ